MRKIETLDATSWEEFLAADTAVLILAKTTCEHCRSWAAELEPALADNGFYPEVRFGKLLLDTPGLIAFKRANPWIAEVDDLPYNVIYRHGKQIKSFAGGGLDRLRNRLNRALDLS